VTLSAATKAGHELKAEGSLSDLWAGRGLKFHFDMSLASPAPAAADSSLAPRHISGQLSGEAAKLEIDALTVDTGLADIDLAQIGPISVSRVKRDTEGRVQLEGVRLLQGDPSDPMIDLSGDVEDLLRLSGITAAGTFALTLAPLLGFPASADLGVLRGSVALSDATGALEVETLDAATGTGAPVSLSLKRATQCAQLRAPCRGKGRAARGRARARFPTQTSRQSLKPRSTSTSPISAPWRKRSAGRTASGRGLNSVSKGGSGVSAGPPRSPAHSRSGQPPSMPNCRSA
jgi:hypothetical protein